MQARPYQQKAIDEIRRKFADGCKRVLLQLATGGGKTFIFSTVFKGAHSKNTKCAMLVRGRALVDQAHRRLLEMEVPHGVHMASHPGRDETQNIQICSVDTLHRRPLDFVPSLVVIDEAHLALSPSFLKALEKFDSAFWLSVTATPWTKQGMKALASEVVYPISFDELVGQGYLVRPKYFSPSKFDIGELKIANGEYTDESILLEFDKQKIYGELFNSMVACSGEPTLIFASSVKHAYKISESLTPYTTAVVTAETSLSDRRAMIADLTCNKLDAVVSVGTMTTGVDIPALRNIILCRPTTSRNLYVQILGRGTRPYSGKQFFRIFDHVGNIMQHGFIEDEKATDLEPQKKRKAGSKEAPAKTCPECFAVVNISLKQCPECEHKFKGKEAEAKQQIDSEMVELFNLSKQERVRIRMLYHYNQWLNKPYPMKFGYVWAMLLKEFTAEEVKLQASLYHRLKQESQPTLVADTT